MARLKRRAQHCQKIAKKRKKAVEDFEGGFGAIYKATWLKNNRDEEVILKCHKNLNENLNEFLKEWGYHTSEDLSEYMVNLKSLDENTSKKLNEILESEDSQASVKVNEMLVSEDLSDYIIKDLGSLDIKTDEN
ncbi:kinase-like domain-containing protein [Rhizophagus irregularis DAOM 181602=DAOM 197198]|nr:kinase-like domain-containing protein [Rhizophagus irregularis DAOM 181602=DAOM 197198]